MTHPTSTSPTAVPTPATEVHLALARGDRDTAWALLRALLAEVGGPHQPVFTRRCGACGGPHGKPLLVGSPWHTGLSYAGGVVAVAVTSAGPVGVDVERVDRTGFAGFAAVALGPGEVAGGLPDRARTWTRKEAVLKATGHGLSQDPRTVVVSAPAAPPALLAWPAAPGPVALHDVAVPEGYACSVAVLTSRPTAVRLRDAPALPAAAARPATG